jgi:pimeloyl-ACP methyl ester carboxylesterase
MALRFALLGMDASDEEIANLRGALRPVEPRVLAHRARQIVAVDARDDFSRTTAPVLYIAGRGDRLVGPSARRCMQRLRPDMQTRVLDAPHLVLQRRPAESADIISEYLRERLR